MKKIICRFIILFMLLMLLDPQNVKAESNNKIQELYAISAALIDGDSGRVLYEKNGYDVRAMASTTKIMTLILALEYGNLEEYATVSSYAAKMPDVQLGLCEGEQYKLYDLLFSLILESHNDTAVVIAEHISGSVEKFAKLMNDKARELGLDNTYFITPNGLDAADDYSKHSTTATDLALIMKYCIKDSPAKDKFISICQTRNYSFADYTGKRSFTVNNKNSFLDMMDGVVAGKTGFTADAGYCYVCAVENDGKTYIIALLGCGWPNNKSYKWQDSKKLFEYAINNYEYKNIINSEYILNDVAVIDGIESKKTSAYIDDKLDLLVCDSDKIDIKINMPETVKAPINKGDIIGNANIYINDELMATLNIYCKNSIQQTNYRYFLDLILEHFLF